MERERSWSDLPPDILSLILSHLFAGEGNIFHAVCKSWRSITPPIRLLPPPVESPLSQSPCSMILNRDICEFYHPVYNAKYRIDMPELHEARIRCSNYGWLLMSQGEHSLFFFNPFTKVKLKLPDLPDWYRNRFATMSFSSPPTSLDCVVIGIPLECIRSSEIGIIKSGEDEWTFLNFDIKYEFCCYYCSPVFYNGQYYCLGETGNIGVLDLRDNRLSWEVHGKPFSLHRRSSIRQIFMVEDDGGMLAVFVTHDDRRVRVSRFDLSNMTWEKVHSLGDKTLYVSYGASFIETTPAKGMGNKIYFSKFHGDNGVFYSLDTGKYHFFNGNYVCASPSKSIEPRPCTWIKPMLVDGESQEVNNKSNFFH